MRKIRASREWKSMVNRLALALSAALLAAQATTVLAAPGAVFGDRTFIEAVKRIRPSVVHIRVTLRQSSSKGLMDIFDRGKSPSFDFGSPSASAQTSVGAGVIISKDGYILTNQHIVKNAEEIRVKLHSGEEFTAKLNGVDKKTDLALLKIPAKAKLTPAKLGNSDAVEVGEWVLAVGSPFGLSHSASVGIISAKGRDLRQGPYDSYIQTDAAINPGNSGGPLANSRGEVIGINTIIYTRGLASKNQGVGFAVPINQAKPVIDDLRHKGYPIRGRLGISINAVPSKMGKKLGLARLEGARLATVIRGGPADKAGLERGDVVIE
ncbi:MAG: trypsin-like serine protease, partial [Nitrospinaceae bacterium]|nr:trypsin-like serine protease [Nitrospinaceae bacterium]